MAYCKLGISMETAFHKATTLAEFILRIEETAAKIKLIDILQLVLKIL